MTTNDTTAERERLAALIRLGDLIAAALDRATASMADLLGDDEETMAAWWARIGPQVEARRCREQLAAERRALPADPKAYAYRLARHVDAATAALPDIQWPRIVGTHMDPSPAEDGAHWNADILERLARRGLELHRTGDGPACARWYSSLVEYARLLRVAAKGRWPHGLEELVHELRAALDQAEADARRTAKGALRAHELTVAELSQAGNATLAARVTFEARHELAELRRIAAMAEPADLY